MKALITLLLLFPCLALASIPSSVQLGMNGVPVDDQGWEWGTCLTSAVIDGLNAYHGWHGDDRISATCFIQLSRSLPSVTGETWWDDGDPTEALLWLSRYGVITIGEQASLSINGKPICGGLAHYPFTPGSSDFYRAPKFTEAKAFTALEDKQRKRDGGMGMAMSIKSYEHFAHRAISNSDWHLMSNGMDSTPTQIVNQIKHALSHGDRVVVGLFIDPYLPDQAQWLGAMGRFHMAHDSWIVTRSITRDIDASRELSGHAILITGYDDKACVGKQCGLFTARNSVGSDMGDHGDYYVSYDYVLSGLTYGALVAIGPMA